MIFDDLTQHEQYNGLHPAFAEAFKFLLQDDIADLPEGKNEIDGDRLFAMVAKGQGRKKTEAELEVHDNYIDIQVVLDGVDEMGWKARKDCTQPSHENDNPENDVYFFKDEPDTWLTVRPGQFAIFLPEDGHLPMTGESIMHKVIVKVRV